MEKQTGTVRVKRNFPEMLKGGVIMDVVNAEQARIAEEAGASAVMALERVPADIRAQGGVARMSDPELILGIKEAVTIPVMAKARIGHFVEAEIIQALGVDCIDESEVLTPADETYHINKHQFEVPFVCGARDLGEALRRIGEGAAMIRSKGEAGTGNIVEAVRHLRAITDGIRRLTILPEEELMTEAKNLGAPYELVREVRDLGRLPVVLFCAGGVATPADAALVMRLGSDGVFVGSGIFKSSDPLRTGKAITDGIRRLTILPEEELMTEAKNLGAPYELVREVRDLGRLPVVLFCAGGVATPADAALVMRLGSDGVFVGSGIFKSADPLRTGKAIVRATTHYQDPAILAEVSRGLGEAMRGIELRTIPEGQLMAQRGW